MTIDGKMGGAQNTPENSALDIQGFLMRPLPIAVLAGCALLAADLRLAAAQSGRPEGAVGLIERSRSLIARGRASNDPLALLAAARAFRDSGAEPAQLRPGEGRLLEDSAFPTPHALALQAKHLAKGRGGIIRKIDAFLATADKGRESGPLFEIAKLPAGGAASFPALRFSGGKRAEVYVESTHKVAVELYDSEGAIICKDDRGSEVAYCWWRQTATGTIRVELKNKSDKPATYRLVTN